MSELVCKTLELLAETKGGFTSAVKNIFNTKSMATLKISDLSVGDWVNVITEKLTSLVFCEEIEIARGYIHTQIKGIREDGYIAVETADRRYALVNIGCISPVPITAEILEKNGLFRHERDADNPELIVLSNHFIMARTYTDVDWWRVLIYDEELPSKELFNGIIYSVHQLQHALRLAGIDKEINL